VDFKKAEILNRVAQIVLRFGIKSVTMDDLARELAVSKKTLYAHFGDKRKMIQMLVAEQVQLDKSCCESKRKEALNAIDEMFQVTAFVTERLKTANITFFYDLRTSYPKAFKTMEDYKWGYIQQTIIDNINRGKSEGIYRQDMDSVVVAKVYLLSVDMIFGGQAFLDAQKTPYELFLEIFHLHMRGIVNEKGLELLIEHLKYVKEQQ
jgi:TetR/AcrR family transcriptional regulator, cholesterol catabolism regulator